MTWTCTELAYFAGILDGEGTIGARNRPNGKGQRYTDMMLSVAGTDKRLIDWLSDHFGGSWDLREQRDAAHHKALYRLTWTSSAAEPILRAVLPHLVIKQEQAQAFLDMRALIGTGQRLSEENKRQRSELIDRLHELNRRGKVA